MKVGNILPTYINHKNYLENELMAIESVRAECQQMGVKEFFQIDVFWLFCVGVK